MNPPRLNRETDSAPLSTGVFHTTRWTEVFATQGDSAEAKLALSQLCEAYWTPVFRFLCRERRDPSIARELTQEFFTRILAGRGFGKASPEGGRFRSYLLGAVRHFLSDIRERERAAKRGGGESTASIEANESTDTGHGFQLADVPSPANEVFFDRQWAFTIMDNSLSHLAEEFEREGRGEYFTLLKPWLVGDLESLSQAEAARALNLREGAVKVAIHRLRKRFHNLVRSEVAHTVPADSDIDAELRYLVKVLAAG